MSTCFTEDLIVSMLVSVKKKVISKLVHPASKPPLFTKHVNGTWSVVWLEEEDIDPSNVVHTYKIKEDFHRCLYSLMQTKE